MKPRTYSAKPGEVTRQWYLLDASKVPLGRLATVAATYLMGKHKPTFTSHIDVGDSVVVIHASKLKMTGNKAGQKMYYRHSGYIGNLKEISFEKMLAEQPERIVELAVRGMLPVNKLRPARLARLKVYAGSEHQQVAQQPTELEVK